MMSVRLLTSSSSSHAGKFSPDATYTYKPAGSRRCNRCGLHLLINAFQEGATVKISKRNIFMDRLQLPTTN